MATGKTPTRKLRTGRRTVRTQGISQSNFAGYGVQQQPTEKTAAQKPKAPEDAAKSASNPDSDASETE